MNWGGSACRHRRQEFQKVVLKLYLEMSESKGNLMDMLCCALHYVHLNTKMWHIRKLVAILICEAGR